MDTINQPIQEQQFLVKPHQLNTQILDPSYQIRWKRKNASEAKNIYTVPAFLSPEESARFIELAEKIGFQTAGLAVGQDVFRVKDKTRNNGRVMFEDQDLAAALWLRLGPSVDKKYDHRIAFGLNWRFRIYKYEPGQFFAPHVDECMVLPGTADLLTRFTFMVYLNDRMEGGETTFFHRRVGGKMPISHIIRPKIGMALAFDHLLFHEGSAVTSGVKYVLRSDIVYQK